MQTVTKQKNIQKLSIQKLLSYLQFLESPQGFVYASDTKFHRLFGRDSVITSLELLHWYPDCAKNTIIALAKLQRENGQIIHEIPNKNTMWDSLDSTPLFLVLISEYYNETNNTELIKKLLYRIKKAISWIENVGDSDNDGILEYYADPKGLFNQCWKDSRDGITTEKKEYPQYPIAPSEIQGYLYKAYIGIANIYNHLEHNEKADILNKKAKDIKKNSMKNFG